MGNKNKIALISNDYTKSQITLWKHESELSGVLCLVELENFCIKSNYFNADPAWCEGVDWQEVCGIVLLDADGEVNQHQVPALGISVPPEGHELYCKGLWVTLCEFSVFLEDIPLFDHLHKELDKCNPCEVAEALRCCLIDLATIKDDKAGVTFMDSSVTFRKPDIAFIERMEARYSTLCLQKRTCGRQGGRLTSMPIGRGRGR